MNLEMKALVKAGATYIQIDEPYYSGFPEDLPWGVKVLNTMVEGVDAKIAVHICYGNRYGKPSWEGSYRYLFPAILEAKVHQLTLEFARRGGEDLDLFKEFHTNFELGVGVIDVKTHDIETPEMVAERIRKALEVLPAERIFILPDCGCSICRATWRSPNCRPWWMARTSFARSWASKDGCRRIQFEKRFPPVVSATWWNWWPAPRRRRKSCGEIASSGLPEFPKWSAPASPATRAARPGTIRFASAAIAKERGLTPNVHLTCVNKTPAEVGKLLDEVIELGIENVFAITGDYPKGAPQGTVRIRSAIRCNWSNRSAEHAAAGRWPFLISVAVSPFKYTRSRLRLSISEAGKENRGGRRLRHHAARLRFAQVPRAEAYLDERGLKTPVFGNVYVLPPKAAERMSKGEPPGCWVSPELLERIQEEAKAPDKGMAARLERAAQMAGDRARSRVRGRVHWRRLISGSHPLDHPARRRKSRRAGKNWPKRSATARRAASISTIRPSRPRNANSTQPVLDVMPSPPTRPRPCARSWRACFAGSIITRPRPTPLENAEFAFK